MANTIYGDIKSLLKSLGKLVKASNPRYFLVINDYFISPEVQNFITDITYESNIEGVSSVEFTVKDPFKTIMDTDLFREGNTVDLWMGYGLNMKFMGRGEILELDVNFPQNGHPEIRVRAFDYLHRLMDDRSKKKLLKLTKTKKQSKLAPGTSKRSGKKKVRGKLAHVYVGKRDSDIVKSIFRQYGLIPRIDDIGRKKSRIKQKKLSAYQFLQKLADINSCYFWTEFDPALNKWIGYFKKRSSLPDPDATKTYAYGDPIPSLIDFNPEMVMRNQSTQIEVVTVDRRTKGLIGHRITEKKSDRFSGVWGRLRQVANQFVSGARTVFRIYGRSVEVFSDKTFKTKADAKLWAERFARINADMFITGSGKIIGDPKLYARDRVIFLGLAAKFSGVYEVVQARHMMTASGPYYTHIRARKLINPIAMDEVKRYRKRPIKLKDTPDVVLNWEAWRFLHGPYNVEARDRDRGQFAPGRKAFVQSLFGVSGEDLVDVVNNLKTSGKIKK